MEPRIFQIEDEILAADYSTADGIRAFEDRARSEYTAEELMLLANSSIDGFGLMYHQTDACKLSIKNLADEALNLIVLIRGVGAGGIKYPSIETEDGNKMIHPYLTFKCDLETGKQIDELYNQTIVSLRTMSARAIENNATVQDLARKTKANNDKVIAAVLGVAQGVGAVRDGIAAAGADARRGADAAEILANELEGWREWLASCICKGGGEQTDQAQTNAPPMFVAVRDAIYQLWRGFKAEPADCEMRDGSFRKPGQKRTYAEFVEQYGAEVVYESPATGHKFYLSEYCPNAEMLKKTINAARMSESRKPGAKNSPHKCRTCKRQK